MVQKPSPARHIAAAKDRLGDLSELAQRTEATERKILSSAEKRLSAVDDDLGRLQPRVNLDQNAGDRYQDLMLERGQLQIVIAQSRQALGL